MDLCCGDVSESGSPKSVNRRRIVGFDEGANDLNACISEYSTARQLD
jgi:hypothetical protein